MRIRKQVPYRSIGVRGAPYLAALCVLILFCGAVSAQETSPPADAVEDAFEDTWHYGARLIKFERQYSTSDSEAYNEWAGFIVLGKNPNAFWLTTKGTTKGGQAEDAEIRLFYSYSFAPHIGVQLGWRRDIEPEPKRDWLGLGLIGVLPFKIGAEATLFIGESDRLAARFEIAYRHELSDRWSLTPDLEVNAYSEDDPQTGAGSGVSDVDLGLRLRYRVIEGLSPYLGMTWKGDLTSTEEDTSDLRWLLGVTAWF